MQKFNKNKPLYYGDESEHIYLLEGDVSKRTYDQMWSLLADLLNKNALTPGSSFLASDLIGPGMTEADQSDIERVLLHISLEGLLPVHMGQWADGKIFWTVLK